MKILVIDDDVGMLGALGELLAAHGHEVKCVDTAKKGIASIHEGFDIVLLDYKMPEHDGAWFMTQAKFNRSTRVLLITAYVNKEVIKRMFDLGVSGYLIKPFDADDLLRHIEFFGSNRINPVDNTRATSASA